MLLPRRLSAGILVLVVIHLVIIDSKHNTKSGNSKQRSRHHSRSKVKIDKANPWPFLPSPGYHYASSPDYPSYPFLILAPPDEESENDEKLKDEQGSKYYASRRQAVAYPQATVTAGYVPVYYMMPTYQPEESSYMNYYQPYEESTALSQSYLQYGQTYGAAQPYPLSPFVFFKRSHAKKPHTTNRRHKPVKRQFVPRHHWSFSQWPFDSHEYAFTKDPIHSSDTPHLPRWGPMEWGGAGPGRHWALNRQGLVSPFGIGLAPHMGGQGYIGLGGHWPAGHGFPFPTNFPKSPYLQHHFP